MNLRILLLDDHRLFRSGLRSLLERTESMEVVGEAGDGPSAVEAAVRFNPQVVLVDIHLPGMDGFEAAEQIQAACPGIKVIFLSSDLDVALVRRAVRTGGKGYLLKGDATESLLLALETVRSGHFWYSSEVLSVLVDDYRQCLTDQATLPSPRLSEREQEVLRFLAEGLRHKEIADRLGVGIKSVETYRARLMAKLGCTSTADLIRHAIRSGVVPP